MRKRELEITLQKAPPIPSPTASLEQVSTPAPIAADMIYRAYALGDIGGRKVADLGAGTGIFAAGAALFGAAEVLALEIDEGLVELGRRFSKDIGVDVEWMLGDVSSFQTRVDTVLMNPPFGAQSKHADRPFFEAVFRCASTGYTLCLSHTTAFVEGYAAAAGWSTEVITTYKFPVHYAHSFHRKERKVYEVALVRLLCANKENEE
ncbi:MAG: methyltransferase [Thermoplasmata archaeon]|nr:methyltransferase [Thermoplasmata archaeon]